MSSANPRWGAPRIHGELLNTGIVLPQATFAKYMVRHRKPPSQTWRTFLENHAKELVSTDFLVVPTATFRLLFVFLVLSHDRRRLLHFGVTSPSKTVGKGDGLGSFNRLSSYFVADLLEPLHQVPL